MVAFAIVLSDNGYLFIAAGYLQNKSIDQNTIVNLFMRGKEMILISR